MGLFLELLQELNQPVQMQQMLMQQMHLFVPLNFHFHFRRINIV